MIDKHNHIFEKNCEVNGCQRIIMIFFQVNQTKKKSKGGQRCCVPGCKSWEMEDVVYHTFPKDPDLQIKWLKACGRYPQPKVKLYYQYQT